MSQPQPPAHPHGGHAECKKCGGPQKAGFVICQFCKNPYSDEHLRTAVPCKRCRELSAWGQMKCVRCQDWIVVQCLFCGNVSPHNVSACLSCNEAFAGMPQRKAARDAEIARQRQIQQQQQTMQAVGTWGHVGASFLGSMAGAMVGSGVSHHHHYQQPYPHYQQGYDHGGSAYAPPDDDPGASGYDDSVGSYDAGDAAADIADMDPPDSGGSSVADSVVDFFSSSDDSGGGSWFD